MIQNKTNITIVTGLLVGVSVIAVIALYLTMGLEKLWLYMTAALVVSYMLFMVVNDKELALIQTLIFLLQFEIGFLYMDMTAHDTLWAFDVIAILLYFLWIVDSGGISWNKMIKSNLFYPALGMLIWTSFSIPFSISKMSAMLGLLYQTKAVIIFILIINRVNKRKEIFAILNTFMVSLVFQSIIAILQRVYNRPLGLRFLGEMQYNMWWTLARVQGTFGYPNQFAAYLILLIPFAICLAIFIRKAAYRVFYIIVILLSLTTLILTLSRSSWLGMIVAIILIVLLTVSQKKIGSKSFLVFGVVLVLAVTVINGFYELIQLRFNHSAVQDENRILMIKIALQLIARNPVIGCGLFNFEYHSYSIFQFWHPVHNIFLRLAAETGIPGVSFFIWFIIRVYRNAFMGFRLKDKFFSMAGLGIMGGYTAFLIACQFGPEYQQYRQQTTFWILGALSVVIHKVHMTEVLEERKKTERRLANQKRPPRNPRQPFPQGRA